MIANPDEGHGVGAPHEGGGGRVLFFFQSKRRHTRFDWDWSSDVCSSDLDHMAAYGSGQATLLSRGEPKRIGSAEVTVDFFSLLGVRPLVGRTFLPEEHQAGGPRAVMLSEGLWRDRFGANPSVIGQGITLDGRNVTVVGVLPGRFNFPEDCDVWTSLVLDTSRGNAIHRALARLKPDVTLEQAQTAMDAIARRLA